MAFVQNHSEIGVWRDRHSSLLCTLGITAQRPRRFPKIVAMAPRWEATLGLLNLTPIASIPTARALQGETK
jgi:hypothetical protein